MKSKFYRNLIGPIIALVVLACISCTCKSPIEPNEPLVSPDSLAVDKKTNIVTWKSVINDSLDHYNVYLKTGEYKQPGLIAYFRFDKESEDYTGNNKLQWSMEPEYVQSDIKFATSATGSAVNFFSNNRLNGAMMADSDLLSGGPGKSITVEAWIKVTAYDKDREQAIVTKFKNANFKDWGIQIGGDGRLIVGTESDGNDYYVVGNDSIPVGIWTHIAFTFCHADNKIDIYINGNKDTSESTIIDMPNTSAPVCIGYNYYNQDKFFNGCIDEIRIWDNAKPIKEIQDYIRNNFGYGLPFRVDKKATSYHPVGVTNQLIYTTTITCVGIDQRETKPITEIGWQVQKPKIAVRLEWDPNTEDDLAGYRLYRGEKSRTYDFVAEYGLTTQCIDSVTAGRYYFWALTAFDTAGNESGYSNEVSLFAVNGFNDRKFIQDLSY